MSYIGKKPIRYTSDIKVIQKDDILNIEGRLGILKIKIPKEIAISISNNILEIKYKNITQNKRISNSKKPLWGTYRSLINNMIIGVSRGYSVQMTLVGVGYKVTHQNDSLVFRLGYSHDINYLIPNGLKIICPKPTSIIITGIDKRLVYQVAAEIRSLRKPDAYKGKGIRYYDEFIKLKEGKKK